MNNKWGIRSHRLGRLWISVHLKTRRLFLNVWECLVYLWIFDIFQPILSKHDGKWLKKLYLVFDIWYIFSLFTKNNNKIWSITNWSMYICLTISIMSFNFQFLLFNSFFNFQIKSILYLISDKIELILNFEGWN